MARVRFEPSGHEVEVTAGSKFVDVTDDNPKADVPYSCRSANCGTCRVEVVEGREGMNAPDDDELEVLEIFGNEENVRLCCQLKLETDVEKVTLRVVDPW